MQLNRGGGPVQAVVVELRGEGFLTTGKGYMATDFYSVLKSVILRGGAYEGAWKSGGGKNRPPEERHLKSVSIAT